MALAREGRLMAPARGRTVPVGQPPSAIDEQTSLKSKEPRSKQRSIPPVSSSDRESASHLDIDE